MSRNSWYIALGPLLGLLAALLCNRVSATYQASVIAGMTVWMCVWWFSECLSIAVTAWIPLLVMPLFGISGMSEVAHQYSDSIIFLFIGGFMLAFAIEKWGFHLRIALWIISKTGHRPASLLAGIMLSTYLISNWISNTATAVMLLSAVLALIKVLTPYVTEKKPGLAPALLLGLAFSATIGGMATPVGTPPNMYFYKLYSEHYSKQAPLYFGTWMQTGFPLSFTLLVLCFFILYGYFIRNNLYLNGHQQALQAHYKSLGPMKAAEKRVFGILILAILLWLSRGDLQCNGITIKGWSSLLPQARGIDDGWVAICIGLLLFILPAPGTQGARLLNWEDAKHIRYDIILMFGSGFALAHAFEVSGLSLWISHSLVYLKDAPNWLLITGACALITLVSEFASNIASIQLMIPVLTALLPYINVTPLQLLWPATFAASLGFMLPIATAANTLVYGTRQIILKDMLRIGLLLDLIGIALIVLFHCM